MEKELIWVEKELIWVEKEFAEKYKEVESESSKNEERLKMLDDYIDEISGKTKAEWKANLESLEEDALLYAGLNLKVKQTFEKAKAEALEAHYDLWENYENKRSDLHNKIMGMVDELKPLKDGLTEINELIKKIDTYDIDRLINTLEKISSLYGKSQEMVKFLVKNFKK